jgi:hypothetical protein
MIIDQLPALTSVQETDEIPVERGTKTYKATLQEIKDFLTDQEWTSIPVEIWDYNTLIEAHDASSGEAKVFYLTPSFFVIQFSMNRFNLSNINTMLQLKFPGYVKDSQYARILGGSVYLGAQEPSGLQASSTGLFIRPNVTKNTASTTGVFNGILFCVS